MSKELHNKQFIYFDLGGVLFDFKGGLNRLSKITGLPLDDCTQVWKEFDDRICRGNMTCQELWSGYKEKAGYKGQDIDFASFWVENFEPNYKMHELVLNLSQKYPIGLITNVYPDVFAIAVSSGKIPKTGYTSVVQSCEVGSVKPEHKIYQIAQQKADTKPENILLIDDSALYIQAAINEGWKGILFNGKETDASIKKIEMFLQQSLWS
jgi:FMN phosphatase YigB (HAD superfamily)